MSSPKVLNHRARDPAKLLNEARNVAKLDHANIVGMFEIDLDNQPPYLVYQFAPGRPLAALSNSFGFGGTNATLVMGPAP